MGLTGPFAVGQEVHALMQLLVPGNKAYGVFTFKKLALFLRKLIGEIHGTNL